MTSRYRIFCLEDEIKNLPAEIIIEEQYPAFVIVSASNELIEKIQKIYPVEAMAAPKTPPELPDLVGLRDLLADHPKRGPYFQAVRFNSPVKPAWLEEIEAAGCEICEAIGRFTLVVKCPNKRIFARLNKLSTKPRITPYIPHIQITRQFFEGQSEVKTESLRPKNLSMPDVLVASFFTEADQQRARRTLGRKGIRNITEAGETVLIIDLIDNEDLIQAIQDIATRPGLSRLEEKELVMPCNNKARLVIADRVVTPHPTGLGLTGKGQIVAVTDTGLDTGDKENMHPDFSGRVKDIWKVPIADFWRSRVKNPDQIDSPADVNTGHGTHVTGSIIGNGSCSKNLCLEPIEGLAPEAELVFQAVEHKAEWNELGLDWWKYVARTAAPEYHFLGIQNNLQNLFQAAYDQGARIHSNSWGGTDPGRYGRNGRALDQFVWRNKDFLVVVAAGNEGRTVEQPESSDGVIELGGVVSPGTAKNCLTVGATENDRLDDLIGVVVGIDRPHIPDLIYGDDPEQRWPHEPFSSDSLVDVDDIFAMSSRGPGPDGRWKPDVVAPGSFVLSTRSRALPADFVGKWATLEEAEAKKHYIYNSGTSMSTALVSGCAVLVRQYLYETENIEQPTAALLKAAIIHSAQYRPYRFAHPTSAPWVDNEQGWGRVDLRQILKPEPPLKVLFLDETAGLEANTMQQFELEVADSSVPLRLTMVYTDPPAEELIHNLNLFALDPDSNYFVGNNFTASGMPDSVNNVEGIIIENPKEGIWSIRVTASNLLQADKQDFALVISGGNVKLV